MPCLRSGLLSPIRCAAILLSGFAVLGGQLLAEPPRKPANPASDAAAVKASGRAIPLVFEENAGQLPAGTAFAGRTQEYTVQVRPSALRFGLAGQHGERAITVDFTGSRGARPQALTEAAFKTNMYFGNDPRQWHTGIRNYERVALRGLYPGIDAEFYSHSDAIEHDFLLAPGADASRLAMHLAGAKNITLSASGDLLLAGDEGALRFHKPDAYQVLADGKRHPVAAAFQLAKTASSAGPGFADVRFELGSYDHSRELVIDPVITYATYVSGSAGSVPAAVVADTANPANVYIAGTTASPIASFTDVAAIQNPNSLTPSSTKTASFIARLSGNDHQAQIAWVSYYGSSASSAKTNTLALQSTGANLYLGGQTAATDLPTGPSSTYDTAPIANGALYGFVASFEPSTGAFLAATYIEATQTMPNSTGVTPNPNINNVTALAADGNYVFVAGYTAGKDLGPTALQSMPVPTTVTSNTGITKGILVRLDPGLTVASYKTYVAGDTTTANTVLTSVAIDSTESIYFAGNTTGDFPETGVYGVTMYTPHAGKTAGARDAFAAELATTASVYTGTLAFSFWSNGTGDDAASTLLRDGSGNIFVLGTTTSADLVSNAQSMTSGLSAGSSATSYDTSYPAGSGSAGWAAELTSTGSSSNITYIADSAAATTTVAGAAVDAAGNLYITGVTSGAKATFPGSTSSTPRSAGFAQLPAATGSTPTQDNTASTSRVYLLQMGEATPTGTALDTVSALGYFGSGSTTSTAAGVAVDTATSANAYVLLDDKANVPVAYVAGSAAEPTPPAMDGSLDAAYLAQVGFGARTSTAATIADGNATPCTPTTVGYGPEGGTGPSATQTASTLTCNWQIQANSAATDVVFNFPYSQYLQPLIPSTSSPAPVAPTVMVNNAAAAGARCSVGPLQPKGANAGITCVVPSMNSGDNATISFQAQVSSAVNNSLGGSNNFPLVASAYDAQGDTADLTQTISVAGVPNISVTSTATASVNAALTTSDTTGTVVTYTYTVTNNAVTPVVNATGVTLATNIGSATQTFSILTQGPGPGSACDVTQAGGCSLASGASLTYVITGVYLTSDFGANGTGTFTSTTNAPTVSFNSPTVSTVTGTSNSVNILTKSQVNVGLALTAGTTYGTGYALGQAVTYKVTLTNGSAMQATNLAYSASASVTLPSSFVANAPTAETNSAAGTTQNCAGVNCTFTVSQLPGDGGQVVFDITGHFLDDGTANDAVAPTATSGSVTETASVPANFMDANGYVAYVLPSASLQNTIYRINTLSYNTSLTSSSSTVNETNPNYTGSSPAKNDTLMYTTTVSNSGPSVVRGLTFTIPLPSAVNPPAVGGFTPNQHIVVTVTGITPAAGGTVSTPNLVTCAPVTPGATQITCTENDYTTPAATATTTPAGVTYTVTFTLQFDEQSVAQTVSTQVFAPNNASYSTSDALDPNLSPLATGRTVAPTAASITVQRATNVKSSFAVTPLTTAAATANFTYTYLNLDEHTDTMTGVPPGKNDTLQFAVQMYNNGPDDSAQSSFTITLPGAMRVAIPSGCSLTAGATTTNGTGGTQLYLTGSGATLTCIPASSTTTAGTYTGQLLAGGSCAGAPAAPAFPGTTIASSTYTSAGCFAVYFDAKYVDDPVPANTVIPGGTTATKSFAATLAGNDVDPGIVAPPSVSNTVQRAAHVKLVTIAKPTYTASGAAATLPTDSGGVPEIAEAAAIASPTAASGSEVYNCVRYAVTLLNEGPNYAIDPNLAYALSQGSYTPLSTTGSATTGVNCAGPTPPTTVVAANVNQGLNVGPIAPTATPSFNLDGFFNLNALGTLNSTGVTFQTKEFNSFLTYNDSDKAGTTGSDFAGTQALTLVNTPINDTNTTGFTVTAHTSTATTATDPVVNLTFTNVTQPGATSVVIVSKLPTCAAVAGAANTESCLPYGKSPYPPDNGAVRNLYQPGSAPNFYQVPTTATVPVTANPTTVCIASPTTTSPLPDVFVKPERALLWVLANPTSSITYQTFPTAFPALMGSLTADVTTSITPFQPAGKSAPSAYVAVPANLTFPQPPQAQPLSICGSVNGLVNTSTAASAETFGVLEPTNFPPYVVAGAVATSASASKGSTAALSDLYVQIAFDAKGNVVSGYTYDYNDHDPCFSAGVRTTCSDNPYLTVIGFADVNGTTPSHSTPAPVSQLYKFGTLEASPASAYELFNDLNLSSQAAFVAVADQATGADIHNQDVQNAAGYSGNPFNHQGGFLTTDYSSASSGLANTPICDPGTTTVASYITSSTPCPNAVTLSPTVRAVLGGQESAAPANYSASPNLTGNYYYFANVGAEAVTGSGTANGGGLIPLPYPDPATPPTQPNPYNPGGFAANNPLGSSSSGTTEAVATVTPGQTAGFVWTWLQSQTQAAGVSGGAGPNDKYDLSCVLVTPTAYAVTTPPPAFPAGMNCYISTTNPNNASASPTVYNFSPVPSQITAVSVASNVVTVTANNTFVAGQSIIFSGLTQASFLNGLTLTVLANPTGTQFQVQYTHADMGSTSDSGTATPLNSTSPTIFVSTTGNVYAHNVAPSWKRDLGEIALAMLLPAFFFRKRLGKAATMAVLLLTLAAAPLLTGCGSGGALASGGSGGSTTATASGQYFFRVVATPEKGSAGTATITSAVFEVIVQNAN